MPEYEIWIEGYAATGERSGASLIGKATGENFDEACINFRYPNDIINEYAFKEENKIIVHKGDALKLDKESNGDYRRGSFRGELPVGIERINAKGNYSIWACQLFPTEQEARKSFG
jgi:hypothetical protein